MKNVLFKSRGNLTGLSVKGWCVHTLQPWSGELLQALLLIQLALAPVLLFSFPLLCATIGLMVYGADPPDQADVKKQWWLLLLGLIFILNACLGSDFRWSDPQLWEWEGGLCLAWLVGKGFSPEFVRRVLRYLVFSSIIWLMTGFAQVWAGVPTPSGWLGTGQESVIAVRSFSAFGNPNIFAVYLLTIIGLAAGFARSDAESPVVRVGAGLILLLALGALYLTYSRVGWLLAAGFLWFWIRSILPVRRRWLVYLAGGLLLGTLAGFQVRIWDLMLLKDSSLAYRFRIWEGVAGALREHWLWGTGPGSFIRVYPEFQIGTTPSQHAHSFYWQFWLEYGLTGFTTWLYFCVRMGQRINRYSTDWLLKAAATAWLFFLGCGLTESWQASRFCNGYFWFLTGILLALSKKEFSA